MTEPATSQWQRMDTLGMTPRVWLKLLRRMPQPVDPVHRGRLVRALSLSLVNSAGRRWRLAFDRAPAPAREDLPVVFIIGHWRSGTTFMHHLLSQDRARFEGLPQSMAVFPHLHGTPLLSPVLRYLGLDGSYKRLMDNVIISPDAPMELEFALMNLTGNSEYLNVTFPRERESIRRYLRLRPDALDPSDTTAWGDAAVQITRRLARTGRTVLHKNPPSMCTVTELKALFPRARFVFLSRDTRAVYPSTLKTWRALTAAGTLQTDGLDGLEDYLIRRYVVMHEAYLKQREALAPTDLVQVRFEDLVAEPLAVLDAIYQGLGWGPVDPEPFAAYLADARKHKQNAYRPLDPAIEARIANEWDPIRERVDPSRPSRL